jgi:hypothetical protein
MRLGLFTESVRELSLKQALFHPSTPLAPPSKEPFSYDRGRHFALPPDSYRYPPGRAERC